MPERPLDGVNLIPYLTGKNDGQPHDQLFWRKREQNAMALRSGDFKLISDGHRQKNNYSLFDLSKDIGEKKDLRSKSPEKSEQLLRDWECWNTQLKDCIFPTLMEDKWWER